MVTFFRTCIGAEKFCFTELKLSSADLHRATLSEEVRGQFRTAARQIRPGKVIQNGVFSSQESVTRIEVRPRGIRERKGEVHAASTPLSPSRTPRNMSCV